MTWTSQVFAYCERGLDTGFWAEPLNALSNVAFLLAALGGLTLWANQPTQRRGGAELVLILVIFAIGTGSFLFHTLATKWAAVADTVPIGIFMVGYLVYAVRRFLGLPWWGVGLAMLVFVATLPPSSMVRCNGGPCFNGSVAYVPALAALVIIGVLAMLRGQPAGRSLIVAGAIFAISLSLRTVDKTLCPYTILIASRGVGTHFAWHLLNGSLLFILVRAAILHGEPKRRPNPAIA